MQNSDNSSPQTPLPTTQLPITPIKNKNQNINIETHVSEKLKGYVTIDTLDTCYNSFLEFKACDRYFLSSFYFWPNDSTSKTMNNVFYFI